MTSSVRWSKRLECFSPFLKYLFCLKLAGFCCFFQQFFTQYCRLSNYYSIVKAKANKNWARSLKVAQIDRYCKLKSKRTFTFDLGKVSRYWARTKLWFSDRMLRNQKMRGEWENLEKSVCIALGRVQYQLKLLAITDQWHTVPVEFRFGRNQDFLSLLLLPLAGGPKDGKRFDADWRLISSASFHTISDNCERNTQKWNSNNKDCKKETIETLMWLRRSCGIKLREAECFATTC